MKFATKKAAVKKAPAKKAPAKKVAAKKVAAKKVAAKNGVPLAVAAAREALTGSTISVQDAAIAALSHISSLVQVTPSGIKPFGLLDRTFNDPLVGVDDSQMPAFYAAVSTAINDARVDALIQAKLASPPSAAATIIDVINLIQFWVDHPDVKA